MSDPLSETLSEPIVYLNGDYVALSDAHISILDRGFIFGDGVYEVIPAYGGHPFRLNHHLQRLDNSLCAIRIDNPLTPDQWRTAITEVIQHNQLYDQSIYLQVTRGIAPRDHRFPEQSQPTIVIMTSELKTVSADKMKQGVTAITLPDNRWLNCHIKSISLLPNVLLRQEAQDKGADEAILIRNGHATEGAASNLFIVRQQCIITPPKSPMLLPGVTRDLVVTIARNKNICLKEQPITEAELLQADEIWLTSSTKEVLPVTRVNDKIISRGKPGPLWHEMYLSYQDYKEHLRSGQPLPES